MEDVKRKNILEKIKKYSVIILIFLISITLIYAILRYRSGHNKEIITDTIKEKVENIVELSTVKYNYTDVVKFKDSLKISGVDLPFTEKSFIIKYSGYLKAGVNLSTIEVRVKNEDTVEISMDKSVVLENVINEEDIVFFDERDSVFNKLNFKDLYAVLLGQKEKVKEEALDRGLLLEAEDNAEEILISLLKEMKYKNIIIKFR